MNDLEAEVEHQVRAWRARIASLRGIHAAIEALWNGDCGGWCLNVNLVTARRGAGGEVRYFNQSIASLRYDRDLRLFDGGVVAWPEAAVARRAGTRMAAELGLEFYFPSPAHADNDCPHWWERTRSQPCPSCGKPLLGDGRSQLSNRCFYCRLEEQAKRSLIADALGCESDRVGYVVREVGGKPDRRLCFDLPPSPVGAVARLASLLRRRRPPLELSSHIDVVLDAQEIASMRIWCEDAIDSHLGGCTPANQSHHLSRPHNFAWRGRQRSVDPFLNPGAERIDVLLGYHEHFTACAQGGGDGGVLFFGNGGVTHRDVSFLRYLGGHDGACTITDLGAAYPFLACESIELTVAKLGRRRFLAREGESLRLLVKGMVVDVAGP